MEAHVDVVFLGALHLLEREVSATPVVHPCRGCDGRDLGRFECAFHFGDGVLQRKTCRRRRHYEDAVGVDLLGVQVAEERGCRLD